jgi:hypothetical protein
LDRAVACHLLTINVGLGSGGKAQHFAQTMAIANVQKQIVAAGKINLVGDRELHNTAAELTRIMGHKNPDQFFNDPTAVNPQTGQLLNPPSAPPSLPPDPKLLVVQAKGAVGSSDRRASGTGATTEGAKRCHPSASQDPGGDRACQNQSRARRQDGATRRASEGRGESTEDAALPRAERAESQGRPPLCSASRIERANS